MALTNFHIKNGYIYDKQQIKQFKTINGTEIKIQASGTGTYKVIGILGDGTPQQLSMVDMSTFDIVNVCTNDAVYCTDIAALTTITVADVSPTIEKIYIDIYVR